MNTTKPAGSHSPTLCAYCGMPSTDPWLHRERYAHDPRFVDARGDLYRFDTTSARGVLLERGYGAQEQRA